MKFDDNFKGDNDHLLQCIDALLDMDKAGSLVPHGIGGHGRTLLSAAAARLSAVREATTQPIDRSAEDLHPATKNITDAELRDPEGILHYISGLWEAWDEIRPALATQEQAMDAAKAQPDQQSNEAHHDR